MKSSWGEKGRSQCGRIVLEPAPQGFGLAMTQDGRAASRCECQVLRTAFIALHIGAMSDVDEDIKKRSTSRTVVQDTHRISHVFSAV